MKMGNLDGNITGGDNSSSKKKHVREFQNDFQVILKGIISSYKLMLRKEYQVFENHEVKIKNKLLKDFLQNNENRKNLGLLNFRFFSESSSGIDESYDDVGYTDITVLKLSPFFNKEKSEFIFECKRLDGTLDLNRKYLTEGVLRFVEEKYCSIHGIHGMLGFVVRDIDLDKNIIKINDLQEKENIRINPIQQIEKIELEYTYLSKHKSISKNNIEITHLMLDYSLFFNN